jgi:hypothetical protein
MGNFHGHIIRTDEEIARAEAWAIEGQSKGTHYPGMLYEDGILAMLDWLWREDVDAPDTED